MKFGCLPSIIPFKPTDGSILENFSRCRPEDLIEITEKAVKSLKQYNLSPIDGPGGIGCGACTLESDLYK